MTEQDELRKKVARILHKTIRQFEVEKCPKVFDLRVHIDQIQALYADKIDQAKKEERERIWAWGACMCNDYEHTNIPLPAAMGGGTVKIADRRRRRCQVCWHTLIQGEK